MFHRIVHWRIWGHPAVIWLAHAAPVIWLAEAIFLPLLSMASRTEWFPDVIGRPIYHTLLWLPVVAVLAQFPHYAAMCTRCAEISKPGTEAPRHVRFALWTFHYVLIEASPGLAFIVADWFLDYPLWFGRVGTVLMLLNVAWTIQAVMMHRWYRMACPYCNDWGDDPDAPPEPAPEPTPPGKTATV